MQSTICYTLICLEERSCESQKGFQRLSECLPPGKKVTARISWQEGAASLMFGGALAVGKRTAWRSLWTLSSWLGEMRGRLDDLGGLVSPFVFHLPVFLWWQDWGLDVSHWSWMASACSGLRQGFGSRPETELRPLQWGCWLHTGDSSHQGPWPVARPWPASCVEMSSSHVRVHSS